MDVVQDTNRLFFFPLLLGLRNKHLPLRRCALTERVLRINAVFSVILFTSRNGWTNALGSFIWLLLAAINQPPVDPIANLLFLWDLMVQPGLWQKCFNPISLKQILSSALTYNIWIARNLPCVSLIAWTSCEGHHVSPPPP